MGRLWTRAWILLSTYYAYMVEYRAELVLWVLAGLFPFILMGVWMEAAQGGQFGLDPLAFARYFLAVFLVRQLNIVWVIWEFEKEVVSGKLSPLLLQPIDPAWRHVASHLAERVARLPFVLALVLIFFSLYPQAFWVPDGRNLLVLLVVAPLVFALRFLMQYTLAMAAFWTERASALEELWFLVYLFLSGLVAPLSVFPEPLVRVLNWTPFPYLISFPASLLVGLPVAAGRGLLVILIWLGVFWVLNRWLWRRGLRQYSGMGA